MSDSYQMADQSLRLTMSETVFHPTTTTQKLADCVKIPKGGTVLDLGCGSGPIAIFAAMKGASHVWAVDIMQSACELTTRNARENGLLDKITAVCGSLFEPVKGMRFDLIIDDVSGIAHRVARLSKWFPPSIPTGGEDGTDLIIDVLEQSPEHINPGGSIVFPILSLSRASKIIDRARELFSDATECIASYRFPLRGELLNAIDELTEMRDEGLIHFEKRGSRYFWTLDIWQATVR